MGVQMKTKTLLIASQFLLATAAFAGGISGGTPPGKESLVLEGSSMGGTPPRIISLNPDDFLANIRSEDLLKGLDGTIHIPVSEDNIRRLKLRASVTGSTPLILESGERFLLERDVKRDSLIDIKKSAEIVKKAEMKNVFESQ
jgi:hypothetical protein